ncbi:MAG: hypothetical protein WAN46_16185 [Gammaproteobacteria bacterium]
MAIGIPATPVVIITKASVVPGVISMRRTTSMVPPFILVIPPFLPMIEVDDNLNKAATGTGFTLPFTDELTAMQTANSVFDFPPSITLYEHLRVNRLFGKWICYTEILFDNSMFRSSPLS